MFPTRLRVSDRPGARILPTKPPRYKPLHLNYLTRFSLSCFCRDRLLRRSATSASPPSIPPPPKEPGGATQTLPLRTSTTRTSSLHLNHLPSLLDATLIPT